MASRNQVTYGPGATVKREQWSNGTQAGDPAAGYAQLDPTTGAVIAGTSRALTAQETTELAAADLGVNQATLQQQAQTALTNNRTYLAIASPSTAQNTAQVKALTQQHQALLRMALGQYDATN